MDFKDDIEELETSLKAENQAVDEKLQENEQSIKKDKKSQPSQNGALTKRNESNLPSNGLDSTSFNDLQNKFLNKQVEEGKTLSDIATDFTKARVTSDIINDTSEEGENFRKDLANQQKSTIKESFKGDKIKEKTKTLDEKKKQAEAFYENVRPILEFDFDNLIHKKRNPNEIKTYSDRSYGIPLMIGMLLFLTIPYFTISIILAIFNGINAVLEEINTFGKIAKYVVLSIVIIALGIGIVYCGICGIETIFGAHIIH